MACPEWVNRDRTAQPFLPSDVRIARKRLPTGKCNKLGRSAIFLVLAAHHNLEPIIRLEDARELLAGKGIEVDAVAKEVDGRFMGPSSAP